MVVNTLVYFIALAKDDLSIVDITWGPMLVVGNAGVILYRGEEMGQVAILNLGMVSLWALRLAWHIGSRHKGEDWRYKRIKARWAHRSYFGRLLCAYLYVFGM